MESYRKMLISVKIIRWAIIFDFIFALVLKLIVIYLHRAEPFVDAYLVLSLTPFFIFPFLKQLENLINTNTEKEKKSFDFMKIYFY